MYKLRPYQQEAVDNTLSYFKMRRDPAVIVLPTGAGKSLVIAELARIARGRVLVLAHVKELVEQNHAKFISYGEKAGIYSAGLGLKETQEKVIFGSIQSVARAGQSFFKDFTLLIIDECHRVNEDKETQYYKVIELLRENNPHICILGLTATPYRLGLGWIYESSHKGEVKSENERFFKRCVFDLPVNFMIKNEYLTRPVKVDIPVTSYDFSELTSKDRMYTTKEVEDLLKKQKRLTPLIIKNVIDITESYQRKGVMIFCSTVDHAKEVLEYLPKNDSDIIIGDTETSKRDEIIARFKNKEFKYLVNVSVLTTGFDAPHVDVVAILRPTESVSLYQQIIGRGLRLDKGKKDCYILDYTGVGYDIYAPQINDKKPHKESVPVVIDCPKCGHANNFWGRVDPEGNITQHYGRKCTGAEFNEQTMDITPCGYRFRFKLCPKCQSENDVSARSCSHCKTTLVDAESKLKNAKLSKNAHVLRPDHFELEEKFDKKGNSYLEVKYYDFDAQHLKEIHYLNNLTSKKKFHINFLRSHLKRPERKLEFSKVEDIIAIKGDLRMPTFIIARKQDKFWRVTEKIFTEELTKDIRAF